MMVEERDLAVRTLGPCELPSPMSALVGNRSTTLHYVDEGDRVLFDDTLAMIARRGGDVARLPGFEPAGPRRRIYFDPATTKVGIATCGGLCPGLNNVVRALVVELVSQYGVSDITGFRNGYQGFIPRYGWEPLPLTLDAVATIDEDGGTILGTSRGQQDPDEIVDRLDELGIEILFIVGGDGAQRGALAIGRAAAARGDRLAVVGVPKTIDNDIPYLDQSFGFQTAFARAAESIRAAHVEATSAPGGVGLVKVMGRHSGFIACYAALAKNDADVVLIPEVPFELDGERGLLEFLRRRVADRGHAVVVTAEGAGQELLAGEPPSTDASGNVKLRDIGLLLAQRVTDHAGAAGAELNLRYLDPSYAIRSVPANPYDAVYCLRLAHAAVHAAMSGRTEMVVGRWHRRFVHVPITLAVSHRSTVDPGGDLWLSVLEATGQPPRFA